jgi:nucleotide-binding universal stress UspA family protein
MRQAVKVQGGSGMSVPAARRVLVGVDGSLQSVAALRWACREAAIRGAEVHAVHVREELRRSLANYAVPAQSPAGAADDVTIDIKDLVDSVQADTEPRVAVHLHLLQGLAARVLLDQCAGADMLVLGTSSDLPGAARSAGPVIRACLRRAPCPVVVISAAQDPLRRRETAADAATVKIPAVIGA